MPPARPAAAQQPSLTPFVLAIAVAGALAATWFRLPGAVIVVLGITIAALVYKPPATGKPAEPLPPRTARAMRVWRELRWRALIPNADWLLNAPDQLQSFRQRAAALVKVPGLSDVLGVLAWAVMPTRFVQLVAVAAGAAAFTLPTDRLSPDLIWVNALAGYVAVAATDAVIRRTATEYDPSPGVPIGAMTSALAAKDGGAWRAFVGLVLLGLAVATAVALTIIGFGIGWLIVPWPLFAAATGLAVTAACLHAYFRSAGLEGWRDTVAARAAWVGRWEGLKQPETFMVSHEKVGPATVDTFEAPATLGAVGAINLYRKVLPFLGAGVQAAMLTVPDVDSQGQPIPGSAHPSRFRVVVWPADETVDVNSAETGQDVVALRVETAAFLAATEAQYPVPILLGLEPQHADDSAAAVWSSAWTSPVPMLGQVQQLLDADAFTDGADLYFGDFDGATLRDRKLLDLRERVSATNRWNQRWKDLLKQGAKPPAYQYDHRRTAKFDDRSTLTFEPFLVLQGLTPTEYFAPYIRQGLSTTLKAAPFVTVTGLTGNFVPGGAPGERHPQGFAVIWSERPMPASPADVPPSASRDAQKWVLAGQLNAAFDAAKLARPELVDARVLTHRDSKGHVWRMSVRLFDGVTAADVKARMEKLRQTMGGVAWMRVTGWEHGCLIYAGATPRDSRVRFANPSGLATCNELDWEQAFLDAGLTSPMDGAAPKMLETSPLETNPKVTRFVFTMPRGRSLPQFREKVNALRSATVNDYVDIRPGDSPDRFVVLASEQNPIPFPAPLDWEKIETSSAIPFASAVDGSTVEFDWRVDPQLLIVGGTGSGKSVTIQSIIIGAIARGADLYIVDPVKAAADFRFAEPWTRALCIDTREASAMMTAVYQEVERRRSLNGQHGVGSYTDLPDDIRPPHVVVILDEFVSLMTGDKPARLTGQETTEELRAHAEDEAVYRAKRNIGMLTGRIAREARSAGVTLVLAAQEFSAKTLDALGLNGLKTNLSRIGVGKMNSGQIASAFKNPESVPKLGDVVPKGRGVFESSAAEPIMIQSWFEPGGQAEMAEQLTRLRPHLRPDEKLDVATLIAAQSKPEPVFGQILDDDDDIVVDLGAEDLGLEFDLGLSFDTDEDSLPEVLAAPELLEPVYDTADTDPEPEVPGLDYSGMEPLFEVREGLAGTVRLGDIADGLRFGLDLPLPAECPKTGWNKTEAVAALLERNPGIDTLVWVDPDLDEDDDIGVPRIELARDLVSRHGVTLLTEEPEPEPVATDEWFAEPVVKNPVDVDIDF